MTLLLHLTVYLLIGKHTMHATSLGLGFSFQSLPNLTLRQNYICNTVHCTAFWDMSTFFNTWKLFVLFHEDC